jgi:DNA ligase-4
LPIASRHFEAIFRANVNLRSAAERDKWLTPEMGINIAIMSSQKCTGLADIYKNYSGQIVAVETKYDGERLQVHMFTGADGNFMIRVFNKSKRDATQERQNAHEYVQQYLIFAYYP